MMIRTLMHYLMRARSSIWCSMPDTGDDTVHMLEYMIHAMQYTITGQHNPVHDNHMMIEFWQQSSTSWSLNIWWGSCIIDTVHDGSCSDCVRYKIVEQLRCYDVNIITLVIWLLHVVVESVRMKTPMNAPASWLSFL
jgi:hypothetical protein